MMKNSFTKRVDKKQIIAILFMLCLLLHPECADAQSVFNGCYVGASGGIGQNLAETDTVITALFEIDGDQHSWSQSLEQNISETTGWGEVFLGIGHANCKGFYFGGRCGVNLSDYNPRVFFDSQYVDTNDDQFAIAADTESRGRLRVAEVTFDIKPGYIFQNSCFMVYGLGGIALNRTHLKGRTLLPYTNLGSIPPTVFSNEVRFSQYFTGRGYRAGVGFEHFLTNCISLHGYFVYTWYTEIDKQVRGSLDNNFETVPNGILGTYSFNPRKQFTALGLTYYF